ncbi:2,3-diphosphoglycerate-dependent phosphoglycerate mutase [uncultured Muribaculum sp.]|uniref:2,3-diphosphoglycerate-dependent phosphoglycerate mutase n=4 Tax=uncultured Muribaculum sp. TaxID=1918613 RepID=UPI0025B7975D|nr:2,3-diphosphoglycerate-dependent phosphoglycerate mutase [uncultured Muribaculum sp.]
MPTIILLRHGQSIWNLENRFTGWTDVDLSDLGRKEAQNAGEKIIKSGLKPDFFFTSYLKRAIHTLQIAANVMDLNWIPVIKDWHLNERHYGTLQGLNKAETAKIYGDEQVLKWRRAYDITPPALEPDDKRNPANDPKYQGLSCNEIPLTESLKQTVDRVRSCWQEVIEPRVRIYNTVLISAHGNSLRALAMMLLHLSPQEVLSFEIPTGQPLVFTADSHMNIINKKYL